MYDARNMPTTSLPRSSFDNNGNTVIKVDSTGTTQYFWDFENRIKR